MPLSKFLTRLIWLCLLPPLLFAVWLAADKVAGQRRAGDEEAERLARNFATAIDRHLEARIAGLAVLAAAPAADDPARRPELYRQAQAYRAELDGHVVLADVGEPMRMLFNTRAPYGSPLPLLPRPEGHAAAPAARATGRPAVGDRFPGPLAGQPLVAIAVPAMRSGQAVAILLAVFETRHFQQRLDQVALPAGWSLSLLDSRGEVIARRGGPPDGGRRQVVASALSRWSVVLEIPASSYHAPLVAVGVALAFGVLIALLASLVGGFLAGRRLGREVAALADPASAPTAPPSIREIAAVRDANALLEQRVKARTAELAEARDRIARYAAGQQSAIEAERRRLSREVHDQIGQVFTAIQLLVGPVRDRLSVEQQTALDRALEEGIATARRITAELRPPLLDDLGFGPAVAQYLDRLPAAGKPECHADIDETVRLGEPQALGLFRIVQEAMTNVLRHAGARRVEITGRREGVAGYALTVADDGRGFRLAEQRAGAMGITGMRERAAMLGGECTVGSEPGCGTIVAVRLPLAEPNHEHPAG